MRAPRPVPAITAVGVARPRAHGHAMTSTATMRIIAGVKPAPTPSHHTRRVTVATPITAGTKTAATRSASRWIGALLPCASRTKRTTCARAVSAPTAVASMRKAPVLFTVAPTTRSPGAFSTGRLSPVSIASSTAERPSSTTPSTAIRSPGRTTSTSPTTTSATGTETSSPSRTTRAVGGCRLMSSRMASPVSPFARTSSSLPSLISVMISAAVSKYTCSPIATLPTVSASVTTTEYA